MRRVALLPGQHRVKDIVISLPPAGYFHTAHTLKILAGGPTPWLLPGEGYRHIPPPARYPITTPTTPIYQTYTKIPAGGPTPRSVLGEGYRNIPPPAGYPPTTHTPKILAGGLIPQSELGDGYRHILPPPPPPPPDTLILHTHP